VRLNSCPSAAVQDSELTDVIHENRGPFLDPYDEYLEIENALPGCTLDLRSSLLQTKTTRRGCVVGFVTINGTDTIKVVWGVAPRYLNDSYREIPISLVPPEPPSISEDWETCDYPYQSRWGTRWGEYRSRAVAHASVKESQAYDHAVAVRSAIVMALDPDVDRPAYPVWPEYVDNGEKLTFGMCPFALRVPKLPDEMSKTIYVRTPLTRSPVDGVTLADLAVVSRECQYEATVIGPVSLDNATNDTTQNIVMRPIHTEQADPQLDIHEVRSEDQSELLNDEAQRGVDREDIMTRCEEGATLNALVAERRMRELLRTCSQASSRQSRAARGRRGRR
jgi:hypothetical protein